MEFSDTYIKLIESLRDGDATVDQFYETMTSEFFIDPFEHVQVMSKYGKHDAELKEILLPEQCLWSLFMFAVYYDRTEIVERLLSEEFEDYMTPYAIIRPPGSQDALHIMPGDEQGPGYNLRQSLAIKDQDEGRPRRQLAIYHAV